MFCKVLTKIRVMIHSKKPPSPVCGLIAEVVGWIGVQSDTGDDAGSVAGPSSSCGAVIARRRRADCFDRQWRFAPRDRRSPKTHSDRGFARVVRSWRDDDEGHVVGVEGLVGDASGRWWISVGGKELFVGWV